MKERLLFGVLVVLHLAPLWGVARVATTDGPSHVYNAYVQLHAGEPLFRRVFERDPRPLPNWLSQAALVPLLAVLPPAAAEKVLVSAYVLLFLGAARYLAGAVEPSRRWLSWLAFLLVFNWTVHFGFYNFGFSLGFYLLALGCWWRFRARPGLHLTAVLTPVLILCYFSHVASAILALFSLGVLWLATLPASVRAGAFRRHLLHLPVLLPHAVLPVWFVLTQPGEVKGFQSFGGMSLSPVIGILCALLVFFTLRKRLERTDRGLRLRWREGDPFLVLTCALLAVYLLSPDAMSGGSLLKARLALYPYLALLPWLAPPGRVLRAGLIGGLALLSCWNVVQLTATSRSVNRDVAALLAASGGIAPGSRVLPLLFDAKTSVRGPWQLTHAFDRAATAKGMLSWANYEAETGYFPNRFRPGLRRPRVWQIQSAPGSVDVGRFMDEIDYVYVWKMPPGSPLEDRLAPGYELVEQVGDARLYERRSRIRPQAVPGEPVVRK